MSKATNKFSAGIRERAVQPVVDHGKDHPSRWAAISSVASKIGCWCPSSTVSAHVFAADKIDGDDTPVPVLAPGNGKTRTGRLWVYVRDDRPFQGTAPPAAVYFYSSNRKGERPRDHLKGYTGFLRANGYPGFEELYQPGRTKPGPIIEVACWAHSCRKIFDVWHGPSNRPGGCRAPCGRGRSGGYIRRIRRPAEYRRSRAGCGRRAGRPVPEHR